MRRYIAFLRGINISGKNKIPMAELKKSFENQNFSQVKTYLNSGNVIFSSDEDHLDKLTGQIESTIKKQFGFAIPDFVISKQELHTLLHNPPDGWGSGAKEIYDNLIFILPPATFSEVFLEIGEPKEAFEKIEHYKNAVFWSFSRKDYQKTNWWSKTASASVSHKLTIRTANTVRKVSKM